METRIQKWGNSLAVRIPMPFIKEAGLKEGASVDISFDEGNIIIAPGIQSKYFLDDLLSEVTRENLHSEIDTGDVVGGHG